MATIWNGWYWHLGLASFIAMSGAIASRDCAKAQITPDGTLPNNSIVTPQGNTSLIEGGTQAGSNLFHSFEQFSVPNGGEASFNNAEGIQNIISRVTGGSISDINGLIRANNPANLFLINPNGIIFGPNATLNIGGSFVGSTASSLNFADGTSFSATAPQATPLLTVSVPLGLQFGPTAGRIVNQSRNGELNSVDRPVGLQVPIGKTLALVGGNVALERGNLRAQGGRIELGSVAGTGLVSLTPIEKGYALGYAGVQNFQDIQLSGGAIVDASGESGGDIQVQGRNVSLTGAATVVSRTVSGAGGSLVVTASEAVEMSGDNTILSTYTSGTGSAGNLTIETRKLTVAGGAYIDAFAFGPGQAGDLTVRASDSVELVGTASNAPTSSGLFNRVYEGFTGDAGTLTIDTGRLLIRDGAQASASTPGAGQAGNLIVRASDSVELVGTGANDQLTPSGLFAQVNQSATGNGGELTIETGRLIARGGAQVSTAARNQGQGGALTINASDSILLSGISPLVDVINGEVEDFRGSSGVFVSAEQGSTSNAGDLTITTGQLTVEDRAKISADTLGSGQGGNATLNVGQLIIRGGGQVRAGSFDEGPGGTLTVNASDSVEVSGTGTIGPYPVNSSLFTEARASGDAGNLNITTESLNVRDRAEVTVSSTGLGKAGELTVQARSIGLDNNGALRATTNSGNGGDITLQAQDLLLLRRESNISTSGGTSEGTGNGGNITIDTDNLVALENSDIAADAFLGRGGRIEITAQGIFGTQSRAQPTEESDITASSTGGSDLSGTVEINNPDVDPTQGLVELPGELVDASNSIATGCPDAVRRGESKFIITGRGGLPPSPTEPLRGDNTLTNWSTLEEPEVENRSSTAPATNSTIESAPTQIVEANGWIINNKGEVILTATAPTVTLDIPWLPNSDCHAPEPSS